MLRLCLRGFGACYFGKIVDSPTLATSTPSFKNQFRENWSYQKCGRHFCTLSFNVLKNYLGYFPKALVWISKHGKIKIWIWFLNKISLKKGKHVLYEIS